MMVGYWNIILEELSRAYQADAVLRRASFPCWDNEAKQWARRQIRHFDRVIHYSGIVFW